MRFLRRVPRNAPLQNLNNLLRELPSPTLPMANRIRLQSIKLIQRPIDRRIGNEVVNVRTLLIILRPRRLIRKRTRPRKAIVCAPNRFRVRERFAAKLWRESSCELFEGAQLFAELNCWLGIRRVVVIEDYGEDGLCTAGVLDCLGGEEEVVVCGGLVVGSVEGGFGACASSFARPFEEEDYAVDWAVWEGWG